MCSTTPFLRIFESKIERLQRITCGDPIKSGLTQSLPATALPWLYCLSAFLKAKLKGCKGLPPVIHKKWAYPKPSGNCVALALLFLRILKASLNGANDYLR